MKKTVAVVVLIASLGAVAAGLVKLAHDPWGFGLLVGGIAAGAVAVYILGARFSTKANITND